MKIIRTQHVRVVASHRSIDEVWALTLQANQDAAIVQMTVTGTAVRASAAGNEWITLVKVTEISRGEDA